MPIRKNYLVKIGTETSVLIKTQTQIPEIACQTCPWETELTEGFKNRLQNFDFLAARCSSYFELKTSDSGTQDQKLLLSKNLLPKFFPFFSFARIHTSADLYKKGAKTHSHETDFSSAVGNVFLEQDRAWPASPADRYVVSIWVRDFIESVGLENSFKLTNNHRSRMLWLKNKSDGCSELSCDVLSQLLA